MKRNHLLTILSAIALSGCTPAKQTGNILSVSIEPLHYLTRQITGDDFEINVLVPPAASPETYEPTPAQMKRVAQSQAYIDIGLLDFEQKLEQAIRENMPDVAVVRTSAGVSLLSEETEHGHGHGEDPHIWTSPRNLKIMAANIYRQIAAMYPDSAQYERNYRHFLSRMDSLDGALKATLSGPKRAFIIYHPALSYMARDYGLTQIAIENEGKEPSAEHVRSLIAEAERLGLSRIFYQRQFSRSTVDALATELKLETTAIDPLGYDTPAQLLSIANLIAHDQSRLAE